MGNYDQQTNETRSIHTGVQLLLVFIGVAFLVAGLVLAAGGSSLIGPDGPVGGLAPWDSGSSGDDGEFQQPSEDGDSDGGDDSSGDSDGDGGEQTEGGNDSDSGDGSDGSDSGDGDDNTSDGSDGTDGSSDGSDGSDDDGSGSGDGSDGSDDGGSDDGSDGGDNNDTDDGSDGGDNNETDDGSDGSDNNETDDGSDGGDGDTSTLSIIVEDDDGNAIEGATVQVEGEGVIFGYNEEQSTDGNGVAEFELEDGEYEVTVTADGYEGAQTTIEISGDDEMLIATLQESGDSDGGGDDNETTNDTQTDG
ncbi:carboxypeptidase regulatory-like domain-containing protein [Natronosalvus rutilus]|uniref:Carboxypeptidase-like regulatory domain-containing protein n=1 Tax=Natronosalvus rutilus TaxID=2953753 RepID=A0A9E7N9B0_9EURY|nr:carboxypeptidase regulatory-like domain-containing protein [Natronosalvus rutilus]UTF54179.1 carboxypeptidase-like regulatory domain-containing protein [Natronosalvus rutilus]